MSYLSVSSVGSWGVKLLFQVFPKFYVLAFSILCRIVGGETGYVVELSEYLKVPFSILCRIVGGETS